jgi:hypothetical protein
MLDAMARKAHESAVVVRGQMNITPDERRAEGG